MFNPPQVSQTEVIMNKFILISPLLCVKGSDGQDNTAYSGSQVKMLSSVENDRFNYVWFKSLYKSILIYV